MSERVVHFQLLSPPDPTSYSLTIMTAPTPTNKTKAKGHVRVVARVRPLAKYEVEQNCQPVVRKIPNIQKGNGPETLQVNMNTTMEGNHNDDSNSTRFFELDAVLDETSTQEELYIQSGAHQAIAKDLFCGYNCTILAYGQTGAGKVSTTTLYLVCIVAYVGVFNVAGLVCIFWRVQLLTHSLFYGYLLLL